MLARKQCSHHMLIVKGTAYVVIKIYMSGLQVAFLDKQS